MIQFFYYLIGIAPIYDYLVGFVPIYDYLVGIDPASEEADTSVDGWASDDTSGLDPGSGSGHNTTAVQWATTVTIAGSNSAGQYTNVSIVDR